MPIIRHFDASSLLIPFCLFPPFAYASPHLPSTCLVYDLIAQTVSALILPLFFSSLPPYFISTIMAFPSLSTTVWFIDNIYCRFLHNPVLAAILMVASYSYINFYQLYAAATDAHSMASLDSPSYFADFLQQMVNLVFISRFVRGPKIRPSTSSAKEIGLLVLQELGCAILLFCPKYSLFYADISVLLKAMMVWQVICPYLILALNIFEEDSTEDDEKTPDTQKINYFFRLLVDTNNNFLPIFIAHSFAAVGMDFPLYNGAIAPLIYKGAVLSLKLFLIAKFILYELVVVIFEMSDLSSYTELYSPVALSLVKEQALCLSQRSSAHLCTMLMASASFVMLTDLSIIVISSLSH